MEKLTVEYLGISKGGTKLGTKIPGQLATETNGALSKLCKALGEDVSGFVARRLHFTREELFCALAVEQIDGVAMAIYNIEARGQSVIIGDQTGLGKGRQAAAMVRYGLLAGYLPVFFTDRYTLFSDMYRDCKALGIQQARPLIVNSGVSVVDFDKVVEPDQTGDTPDEIWSPPVDDDNNVDEQKLQSVYERQYEIVFRSLRQREMKRLYEKGDVPDNCFDYLMMTYSQLKDATRDRTRLDFMKSLCRKHRLLFIFDEAHRSSSVTAGNASVITQCINSILEESPEAQCVFLSATFAKRPECLITFMQRTALSSLATKSTLRKAFAGGGVPMQEYVSTMLAAEGQMLRREQSDEGIPAPVYTYLDEELTVHTVLFDRVMYWFRQMVSLSGLVHETVELARLHNVKELRDWSCYPTRAQLFYINKVLLLALKAKKIADVAVGEVRQGRSVVIGMSDTLECVLQDVEKEEDGSCIGDFSAILSRLLKKTVHDTQTGESMLEPDIDEENPGAAEVSESLDKVTEYYAVIEQGIKQETFHLPMSPIDVIRQLITRETFETPDGRFIHIRFEECTGRAHRLEYDYPDGQDDFCQATVTPRKKIHSNRIFNDFQNNKLDVILVNACGAIGASAHAIATAEVPYDQVRQRKMLIVQNDLDVNIDLQKRGRINRTGQRADLPPLYEYIITAIPSEKRLNMMLRAKPRSLSANTTANQDQDKAQADFTDITNKYGNQVAREFLSAHEELAFILGLKANSSLTASRLLARLAMLSVAAQQDAVEELFTAYKIYETDLRRINQWDLEREHRDFEAEFVSDELFTASFDETRLGGCSYLTTYRCRHRTFPYDSKAVRLAVSEAEKCFGESFKSNKPLRKEIDAYYRQRREKVKDRTAERINILKINVLESLKKSLGNDKLAGELVEMAQLSFRRWGDKAEFMLQRLPKRSIILRRLKSFSNEYIAANDRQTQNLKKISEEARRLRLILTNARLGAVYDMTGYIDTEIGCNHVYAVLTNIRFGKDPKRKFLPGQVEFVFALSAGFREIAINMVHTRRNSNYEKLHDVMVKSRPSTFDGKKWDEEIARFNNRIIERKIVTGNILGAYCHPAVETLRPRFITFTLAPDENGIKKFLCGLLMPLDDTKLREAVQTVTLPLAEGLRYANSSSTAYRITGLEVRMTLLPVRKNTSGGLTFTFHVDEKDANAFEDKAFDEIRVFFKCETAASPMAEKDGSTPNLKKRRERKKYFTDDLAFESEEMQTILKFLVRARAMIVVPRLQITVGEMKQMDSRSLHDENKPWKVLDWQHETSLPLPPSRQSVLQHITPPMVSDSKPGRLVNAYSPFVLLCKDTVAIEGQDLSLPSVRMKLKALYFRWRELPNETGRRLILRIGMVRELYGILHQSHGEIKLSLREDLVKATRSERLNTVAAIKEYFEQEMLFLAPPKEQVEAFLDQCLCSPELENIIRALRQYLHGESDVIIG